MDTEQCQVAAWARLLVDVVGWVGLSNFELRRRDRRVKDGLVSK